MDKYKAAELTNIIMTIIVVAVGAFVLAVLLSGCGGSDDPVAPDAAPLGPAWSADTKAEKMS